MAPSTFKYTAGQQDSLHAAVPRRGQGDRANLETAGHCDEANSALFRPTSYNARRHTVSITPDDVYKMLASHAKALQIDVAGFGTHALRDCCHKCTRPRR